MPRLRVEGTDVHYAEATFASVTPVARSASKLFGVRLIRASADEAREP
jgi:hypothetical protein